MATKNKYWRTTLGTNAEIYICGQVAYTAQATYTLFVANAVNGEVGVFLETGAAYDGSVAAAVTDRLFIAVKRTNADGKTIVERSTVFQLNQVTTKKTTYVAPVKQVTTVVTTTGTLTAGDRLAVTLIETTPGYQPFPTYDYEITAKVGETFTAAVTRLVAMINDPTAAINQNRDQIVVAAIVSTDDIQLTAIDFGVTFRVATQYSKFADFGVTITYITKMKLGSGTPDQLTLMEREGDIFKGVTTNYPGNDALPSEFGKPDTLVVATGQYTIYNFVGWRNEYSPTPVDRHEHRGVIFLATPSNGSAKPVTQLATIFGL